MKNEQRYELLNNIPGICEWEKRTGEEKGIMANEILILVQYNNKDLFKSYSGQGPNYHDDDQPESDIYVGLVQKGFKFFF